MYLETRIVWCAPWQKRHHTTWRDREPQTIPSDKSWKPRTTPQKRWLRHQIRRKTSAAYLRVSRGRASTRNVATVFNDCRPETHQYPSKPHENNKKSTNLAEWVTFSSYLPPDGRLALPPETKCNSFVGKTELWRTLCSSFFRFANWINWWNPSICPLAMKTSFISSMCSEYNSQCWTAYENTGIMNQTRNTLRFIPRQSPVACHRVCIPTPRTLRLKKQTDRDYFPAKNVSMNSPAT